LFSEMRVLLLIALLIAVVIAQSAEERCALHFDDCHACLTDPGCGWCGDYCVGKDSNLCEMKISLDKSSCASVDAPSPLQARQTSHSCVGRGCNGCLGAVGGTCCEFITNQSDPEPFSVASAECILDSQRYLCTDQAYVRSNVQGFTVSQCIQEDTAIITLTVWLLLGQCPSLLEVQQFVADALTLEAPLTINAVDIVIEIYIDLCGSTVTGMKRDLPNQFQGRGLLPGTTTIVALHGLSPDINLYTQFLMDTQLRALACVSCIAGLDILDAGSRGFIAPTGPSPASGNGGSSTISGGALAGIIIACIIAGLIIAAIAAYIFYRRRSGDYPTPFRSPAASYRP